MKHIFLLFGLIFFRIGLTQNIQGNWLLTRIESSKESKNPYLTVRFNKNGEMLIRDYKVAAWRQDGNRLYFQSDIDPKLSGEATILSLKNKQLVYQKNQEKYYLTAYNLDQIKKDTVYHRLLGVWQMEGNDTGVIEFYPDDSVTQLVSFDNGNMISNAQWLYVPDQKAIVIHGDLNGPEGKNTLIEITDRSLQFKHNGTLYRLHRLPRIEKPQETLDFTYEQVEKNQTDIYDLPWSDEALFGYLSSIKSLSYTQKVFENSVHTFISNRIEVKINVNQQKKEINFTYYLLKNDDYIKTGEQRKAFLQNAYNRFFPQKDIAPFRVVNNFETLNIGGKEYDCTVVEGFDGDTKIKYWMINSMPGVYAKIIIQNNDISNYILYQWNGD